MISFIERLNKGEILVCDGAMGTSLQLLGLEPGQAPEEWNIAHQQEVGRVHKSFIDAGCDMIVTNTFGASPIKLKKAGLEDRFEEINRNGVKIALGAGLKPAPTYVLGDIGPTGEFLKPLGDYEEKDFCDAFMKQAKILAAAGANAFIIETMSGLDELKLAVSACKKAASLPIIASMTFTATDKGYRTMMGVSIQQAVKEMLDMECDVIGANCGCGSKQMVEIMRQMRKIAGKEVFLIAQPNAGMPKLVGGNTVFSETPDDFAKSVAELRKIGVNIIGGCCGTTPEHIKEIVKIVKKGL